MQINDPDQISDLGWLCLLRSICSLSVLYVIDLSHSNSLAQPVVSFMLGEIRTMLLVWIENCFASIAGLLPGIIQKSILNLP